MKYLREKSSDPRNTHEIKFGLTKYPREKILDARNTHEKKFQTHEGMVAPWPETHEIHDCTRPTKFSTLNKFVGSRPAPLFKKRFLFSCEFFKYLRNRFLQNICEWLPLFYVKIGTSSQNQFIEMRAYIAHQSIEH